MILLLAIFAGAFILSQEKTQEKGNVLYINRLAGVLPPIADIVFNWDGPFDIMVAPDGGLRTNPEKQLQYYNEGNSKAKTLKETPHGRGAAVDMWPVSYNPSKPLEQQPLAKNQFDYMRNWATKKGLVILGSWDLPHWELPNWQQYPYPPSQSEAVS